MSKFNKRRVFLIIYIFHQVKDSSLPFFTWHNHKIVLKIFLHLQGSHQSRYSTQPWSRHLPNGQHGVWPNTLDGQHWRWRHIFTGRYNEGLLYSLHSSSWGEGNNKELMETNPSHCSCWRRGRSSLRTWRPRPTWLSVQSWGRATTISR